MKAAQLLGLGSSAVRLIPSDDDRLDVAALEAATDEDAAAGVAPCCVVATAGTVGIGAIDPLPEIHALCKRRGLWFHVDGAIGALGFLSHELRPRLAGLERADSRAFDLHKWGQIPYDAGCLLVRDGALHEATFAVDALVPDLPRRRRRPPRQPRLPRYTPALSRADRALKIWMTFQAYGRDRIVRVFERNVAQARHLAARRGAPALHAPPRARPQPRLLRPPRRRRGDVRARAPRAPDVGLRRPQPVPPPRPGLLPRRDQQPPDAWRGPGRAARPPRGRGASARVSAAGGLHGP